MPVSSYRRRAYDEIEKLAAANTTEQIAPLLKTSLLHLGFTSVIMCALPPQNPATDKIVLLDGVPTGWLDTYREERFYAVDNLIAHARGAIDLFVYDEAHY